MTKVKQAIDECDAWLQNCRQQFNQHKPHMPVPVKAKDIFEQRRLLESKITPIVNKPKPKVEPPKEDSKPEQEAPAAGSKKNTSANANNGNTGDEETGGQAQDMDVE